MYRYRLGLRLSVIVPTLMGILTVVYICCMAVDIYHGHALNRIDYIGLALVSRFMMILMLILAVLLWYWLIRHMWFFTYNYYINDNILEVSGILCKPQVIHLDKVTTLSSFRVLGISEKDASSGYILETNDGSTITLSRALSISDEILRKCVNANIKNIDIMKLK